MSNPRAVRYRRLALAEADREKADLLHKIAEEAGNGVLCTVDWRKADLKAAVEPKSANGPTTGR